MMIIDPCNKKSLNSLNFPDRKLVVNLLTFVIFQKSNCTKKVTKNEDFFHCVKD